ncbi:unnamed protein product [Strongylus vulgaris]|uniref:Uncharacterized protein n=1 Tax=Strongylus vulgaris TaxID=40348 RepID=A0A3P7LS15_STRVU|nr:unnamed protein product [Strongylus vulgaris]
MDGRPQRSVEQIEVIEHHVVEEGRRPIGAIGATAALPPYSTVRRSTESYETRDVPLDRRYDYTGERDVNLDSRNLFCFALFSLKGETKPLKKLAQQMAPYETVTALQ